MKKSVTTCNNPNLYQSGLHERNRTRKNVYIGLSNLQKGDYEVAIDKFNKVIELKPNYARAFEYRADATKNIEDYPSAVKDYDRAIDLYGEFSVESKEVYKKRFKCEQFIERNYDEEKSTK